MDISACTDLYSILALPTHKESNASNLEIQFATNILSFFLQNYISLIRNLIKYTLSSWGHLVFNKDLACIEAMGLNPVTSLICLHNPSTIQVVAAQIFFFIGIFSGTITFVPLFLFRTYRYYSYFASYLLTFIFFELNLKFLRLILLE